MLAFKWYLFHELTPNELYALLRLRVEVFVLEQTCFYQDLDGNDQGAVHLLGVEDNQLVAYLRLFPPTNNTPTVFGRVVTSPSVRGKGYGKQLIEELIHYTDKNFPSAPLDCSAQYYLKSFYESLGFHAYGNIYLEDDIPHIAMQRKAKGVIK